MSYELTVCITETLERLSEWRLMKLIVRQLNMLEGNDGEVILDTDNLFFLFC